MRNPSSIIVNFCLIGYVISVVITAQTASLLGIWGLAPSPDIQVHSKCKDLNLWTSHCKPACSQNN